MAEVAKGEEKNLKWVRWESFKRYHAVYVEAVGVLLDVLWA
jgi:hypothetical protein